jgi:hypothetical protein
MTDHLPSTKVESLSRELAPMIERGIVTQEQVKTLAVATTSLQAMKKVATPVGERHFSRIDTMLAVRNPSPISEARDLLTSYAKAWDGLAEDFHKFRVMFFDARLRRAKAVKKRQEAEACKDDAQRAVLEAEAELEMAEVDRLEATVMSGQTRLKAAVEKATDCSAKYALVLQKAGKEELTEADFAADEAEHYLKSAWWHAAQVFQLVDARDALDRAKTQARDNSRREQFRAENKARQTSDVVVQDEVLLYFHSLGIQEHEVKADLRALEDQRYNFNMMLTSNDRHRSFRDHFEGWLSRTVAKYIDRTKAQMAAQGPERLRRIQSLINPDAADAGAGPDVAAIKRGKLTG